MTKFDEFLIALGNADKVGIRKKIVLLKRYIKYLVKSNQNARVDKRSWNKHHPQEMTSSARSNRTMGTNL